VREGSNATGVLIVSGTATRNCTVIGAASFKACDVYTYPPTVTPQPTVIPSPQPSPAPTITRAPVVSISGFRRGLLEKKGAREGMGKDEAEDEDYVLSVESTAELQRNLRSYKKKQQRRLTSILERHGHKHAAYPPPADHDAASLVASDSGVVARYREEGGRVLAHAVETLAKPAGWALRTFLLRAGFTHPDDHFDHHRDENDNDALAAGLGAHDKNEGVEGASSSSLFDSPAAAHAAVGAIVRRARARVAREQALLPDPPFRSPSSSSSSSDTSGGDNGGGGGAETAAQRIKHSIQLSSSEEWQLATVAAEAQARRQQARQSHPPSWHDPLYEEGRRRQLLQTSSQQVPSVTPTEAQAHVQVACGDTVSATNVGAESYIGNDSGDKVCSFEYDFDVTQLRSVLIALCLHICLLRVVHLVVQISVS
jgi:hypothetical protein